MNCEISVTSGASTAPTCSTLTTLESYQHQFDDNQNNQNMSLNEVIHLYINATDKMEKFLHGSKKRTGDNLDDSSITYELEHLHENEEALRRELDGIHWGSDDPDDIETPATVIVDIPSSQYYQDHEDKESFPRLFNEKLEFEENEDELKYQISDETYQDLQEELNAVITSIHQETDDETSFKDPELGFMATAREEGKETKLMRLAALLFGSKPLITRARLSWQVLIAVLLSSMVFYKQIRDNNGEFRPSSFAVIAVPIITAMRERTRS